MRKGMVKTMSERSTDYTDCGWGDSAFRARLLEVLERIAAALEQLAEDRG